MNEMKNKKRRINDEERETRKRLDKYGIEWCQKKNDKEARRILCIQITEEAFKIFAPCRINEKGEVEANDILQEALGRALVKDVFGNFDLTKSKDMQLSNYISNRMKYRIKDVYRDENPIKDADTLSLDMVIDEEETTNLYSVTAVKTDSFKDVEASRRMTDVFEEIMASALRTQRIRGKTMECYRVIYTADIISAEKGYGVELFRFQHKRMIDTELSNGFVNYCMVENCTGVKDIYDTELKAYGEVVEDTGIHNATEPIPLPMEDKVGITFLKTSKGNYSKHHKKYKKLIKSIRK